MDTMIVPRLAAVLAAVVILASPVLGHVAIRQPSASVPSILARGDAHSLSGRAATGRTNLPVPAARFSDVINILSYGADPTGERNSAPAFRVALGSNRRIIVPPGTYLFSTTQNPPCCDFDKPAVLVQSLGNFEIDGHSATIRVADDIALSSAFHFDKDRNFVLRGLTIQGNRTGLRPEQENVGLALSSDVNFEIEDIHYSGNFGGNGAAVAGDWLINGSFRNQRMDAVGHCYDMAYLNHVNFGITHARGADANRASSSGQIGQTCFSMIVDPPNAAQNHTGVSFAHTVGVRVTGITESNFATGALIETGTQYVFRGNDWHDNPGIASSRGVGMWIRYDPRTSVGVPPSDIIVGDRFANNGSTVTGYGLYLSGSSIQNDDTLANISVAGSTFDNNATVGIGSDTSSHFSGLRIFRNSYSGPAQKISRDARVNAANSPSEACRSGPPSTRAKAVSCDMARSQ